MKLQNIVMISKGIESSVKMGMFQQKVYVKSMVAVPTKITELVVIVTLENHFTVNSEEVLYYSIFISSSTLSGKQSTI